MIWEVNFALSIHLFDFTKVKSFKDYVDLYVKEKTDDQGVPYKIVHEITNERWEVVVTQSDSGFKQVSFVNSIATTKVIVGQFYFIYLFYNRGPSLLEYPTKHCFPTPSKYPLSPTLQMGLGEICQFLTETAFTLRR